MMKQFLLIGSALALSPLVAQAQVTVEVVGDIEAGYKWVDDNVTTPTPNFTLVNGAPIPIATPGTTKNPDTDDFFTSAGLGIKAAAEANGFSYGGVIDADLNSSSFDLDEARISVTTGFGRFRLGYSQTASAGADLISVGKSGVTTDIVGAEYAETFEGNGIEYAIAANGFAAALNYSGEDNFGVGGQYSGKQGGVAYKLIGRAFYQGTPTDKIAKEVSGYQVTGIINVADFSFAASYSDEKGEDYRPLNLDLGPNSSDTDDLESMNYGLAVAYDLGALKLSADFAGGTIRTSFVGNPTPEYTAANRFIGTVQDADYTAFSFGAEYELAKGLVLKGGYKQFNDQVVLNQDLATAANTGGVKMKDQSEIAASIKLSF